MKARANMNDSNKLTTLGMWTLEYGEELQTLRERDEVFPCVARLLSEHASGRIDLSEDVGGRSWFARFLGVHPRFLQMHLAIEWRGDVASLIFFDDAVSEYRAKDPEPIQTDEITRKAISHGEPTPHPTDQCMALDRARLAVEEYLRTGVRPGWLQYEYVA
jgi:hypothetical protein